MTRLTRILVALVAALAVAACAGPQSGAPSKTAGALPLEVSVAEAERMREAGDLILDVREPAEWAAGHIPGATLISLGDLTARLGELPRDRTIVVVCRSGNRSAQGRDTLLAAGFSAVTSMAGGMTDWVSAGLPVTRGG
jgi:rhodanese-related sulfurtransferase